jgi:LacI family transcriptional regulator, galactose operon repressor
MARRATAQDVADLVGVSRSAVSLVLNGRAEGNIAAHKQRAIIEAARKLNYTPNAVALSLRSQRTRTIGVITWSATNGLPVRMLQASLLAATARGYLLIILDVSGGVEEQDKALSILQDRQVDALLVIAPELVDFRAAEQMINVPTLLVNCADPEGGLTSLLPDETGAAATAAQLLIEAGHSKIGLLTDPPDTIENRLRLAGVQEALVRAELEALVQLCDGRDTESGCRAAEDLLSGPERPTGLICTHECLALGAVLAAARLGLRIPDDLSLVSLDDGERLAGQLVPPLTMVERPDAVIAQQAVAMLLDWLRGVEQPVRQLSFVCPTALRESVAAPNPRMG